MASAAAAWPAAGASAAGSTTAGCDAAACHNCDTLRYARRYYAHDATLRYAVDDSSCSAAAPLLPLGAVCQSGCSSSPPGAVVVVACCALNAAQRALRASSQMRLRARLLSRSILSEKARCAPQTHASCSETGR